MNPFKVFITVFATGIVILILLDVGTLLNSIYMKSLNMVSGSSAVQQYSSMVSPYVIYTNIFVIIGFVLSFIVMIIYEKNS